MLLVDRREDDFKYQILERKGLPTVRTELEFGDYAFEGRGELDAPVQIGIEYKKLHELVQSMRTSRLEGHQLLGMRSGPTPLYDFAYLYVEGEVLYDGRGVLLERKWRMGRPIIEPMKGGMNAYEFLKRMEVLHLRGGLNVRFFKTRELAMDGIEVLYRVWTDKALDAHTSHIAIYNPPTLVPVSQFRRTINTLPGLGLERSASAQRVFGNIRRAINATVHEWAALSVNGRLLGQSKADAIVAALQENHS